MGELGGFSNNFQWKVSFHSVCKAYACSRMEGKNFFFTSSSWFRQRHIHVATNFTTQLQAFFIIISRMCGKSSMSRCVDVTHVLNLFSSTSKAPATLMRREILKSNEDELKTSQSNRNWFFLNRLKPFKEKPQEIFY